MYIYEIVIISDNNSFIYQNDTIAFCTTKPLNISGVTSIKDSLFIPIYNHITFDEITSNLEILRMMKSSRIEFAEKINNKSNLCNWLKLNYSKYQ